MSLRGVEPRSGAGPASAPAPPAAPQRRIGWLFGGLPLQPDLQPWPPWQRRVALLLVLSLAVLLLGLLTPPRRSAPRLLGVVEPRSDPGAPAASAAARLLGETYERAVIAEITKAKQRIDAVMYSLFLDRSGAPLPIMLALSEAAKRGVQVKICLDSERDRTSGQIATTNDAGADWLRRHGVIVVRDEPDRRTHIKAILIDSRVVIIGSHNWTFSAMNRNRELSLVLDDAGLAREILAVFAAIPEWNAQPAGGTGAGAATAAGAASGTSSAKSIRP